MLRLAFDFIITWRETRTRPNAYFDSTIPPLLNLEFFNSGKRSLLPILRFNHR